MRKENVVNNKGLSSRKSFVRDLPSAKSLLNKEQQPYYMKQAEGPGQRPAGTTTFFNNGGFTLFPAPISRMRPYGEYRDDEARCGGFTLIELLVVVLIIGILVSVALPQYQKAVERARASEAFPLLKAVQQAAQTHYLANGDYPEKFDELAVEIPWTGTTKWRTPGVMKDSRSNNLWSLQLYKETGFQGYVTLGRISGKYEGVGFIIGIANGNWMCIEKTSEGKVFSGNEGDYCVKIMRCANTHDTYDNGRYYTSCPF